MEEKHTKGNWHSGEHGHVVTEFGETICQTYSKQEEDYPNAEANRKLIAAPELLEALQNILPTLGHYEDMHITEQKRYLAAEKAIAKATE